MKITADFSKLTGKIKPMHGVCQPPIGGRKTVQNGKCGYVIDDMFHYLTEAGIPSSRLHDAGGAYGGSVYVDIENIFRNFDADENDPTAYDFAFTDLLITSLIKAGCEPFYRLGATIENGLGVNSYHIHLPKDLGKWARICEHIIRHYNEGWADGFHYDIKYWEIWNEPDGSYYRHVVPCACFSGTPEQFYEMYTVASKHLKACFGDKIKVGGYSSCGFWGYAHDPELNGLKSHNDDFGKCCIMFAHEFLDYISKNGAPLDFFSWHMYGDALMGRNASAYCRKLLQKYGYGDAEDILTEWNACADRERKGTAYAAAQNFSIMLAMQKTSTHMLNYYDARIGGLYGGMFNGETLRPFPTYFAFMSFNEAYKLQNEVYTMCESNELFVLGATDGNKKVLLIANVGDKTEIELDIQGASTDKAEILMIDEIYTYSPTGKKLADGKITIPKHCCMEIRM